ncbi:Ferric iron reductase protein FhuF, involved in iron transport [Paenibacillus algorifonticola]|uniref:Ferric iron reductase protein FhuF, involved in iron transport n=1 Tax=Paenibacillus algorifonticola TaxID=684063 RepID=A0A1I2ENE9_9BACL|nr:IucA/IucC family C-terminal-domain containing protein [Paenibacillus algorifonticola]SFE93978.1 Ferric iron reductase protein FhuF, involved in iron transport [Paenibacillus algorifonticola]
MPVNLSPAQWKELEARFKFTPEKKDSPGTLSILSRDLLEREKCESYLDQLATEIGAPSRRVAASMLAKRYAFLFVAPVLYAMTVYDKGLPLTLDNCRLASPDESESRVSGSKFPNLSFDGLEMTEPEAGKRLEWRDQMMRQLFAEHLSPLFRSLSVAGKVPMAILWENAFVRMVPLYEDGLEEESDSSVIQRLHDDFMFMTETAPASIFGERRNPLAKFIKPSHAGIAGEMLASIRQTCCFYYEMSSEYCRACPKPLNCH